MFMKSPQWIIVFLGNPGEKYNNTRHNVGFMTADVFEKRNDIKIKRIKFSALTGVGKVGGENAILLKPQTYMNLSGNSVREAADFYKLPAPRIIAVSDDVTLETGKIRVRRKGSAGGHNGLKSIIEELGSDEFKRVKIGVGSPENPHMDMADWVLGEFCGDDEKKIADSIKLAAEAVEMIVAEGVDMAMNRYN